ncbi:hypothetical protein KW787_00560 [Candidatus Pacearchaeota archaeon]|nr:hypothetical protein [Candidatus Pacearchaeota archaeon]
MIFTVTIGTILNQWQTLGVFDYVLPFLLLFAVIFGILSATNIIGTNRGVHAIIAVVIALMALQFNYFGDFLKELFPRLGVGIAVLLSVLILFGLFIYEEHKKYYYWGLGAIAFIITLVVINNSFSNFGWYSSFSTNDNVSYIIGGVLLVGLIIAVAAGNSKGSSDGKGGKATLQSHRE